MKVYQYLIIVFLAIFTTACTRVVDLQLGNDTGRLVVEGNITNVKGLQTVKLTQNVTFGSTNTYPAVSGAVVSISDNTGNKYLLAEAPAGTYSINSVAGVPGN